MLIKNQITTLYGASCPHTSHIQHPEEAYSLKPTTAILTC